MIDKLLASDDYAKHWALYWRDVIASRVSDPLANALVRHFEKWMPEQLRNRYARPEPRIAAGRLLADRGATAMIDISDGLAADVQHLSAASEVGIEINLERIPCWEGVEAMAAIASGEEFELLLTMPPSFSDASASSFRAETGVHLTRIGRCLRGSGGRRVVVRLLDNNNPVALPAGYDHFA